MTMNGAAGDDVFLGERLDAVGHRLQESEGAGTVGAVTILHTTEALTLEYGGDGEE
jgi:hypothetical protein